MNDATLQMIKVAIFDAYGTLFDVSAAARNFAALPGNEKFAAVWQLVARDWRHKQLQYSWLRAITGEHTDFWKVTEDGLDWALEASQMSDPELRDGLLDLYRELDAYPEVVDVLERIRSLGIATGILSNGSPGMLKSAVESAGIGDLLDAVLSVEDAGVFKPARATYDLVGQYYSTKPDEILFISSNNWDAASAAGYGFRTVWVNRADEPPDRLPSLPEHILTDLTGVIDLLGDT